MEGKSILGMEYYHLREPEGVTLPQEKALWKAGIRGWQDLLQMEQRELSKTATAANHIPLFKIKKIVAALAISNEQLRHSNFRYFYDRFKSHDYPRMFDAIPKMGYFAIHAYNGKPIAAVIFDGECLESFIEGINLQRLAEELRKYDALAAYGEGSKKLAEEMGINWEKDVLFFDFKVQLKEKDMLLTYDQYLKTEKYGRAYFRDILFHLVPFLAETIWEEHLRGVSSALPTLKSLLADEVVPLDSVKSFLINEQIIRREIPYEKISDIQISRKKEMNR
jgi:hypothetical protein